MTPVDDIRVRGTCLVGQGALCCSFLGMSAGQWVCIKNGLTHSMIEARRPLMVSKGDNCPGPPFEEAAVQ